MTQVLKRKLEEINADDTLSEENRAKRVKLAKSDKHGLEAFTLKGRKKHSLKKLRLHNGRIKVAGALNCSVRERKGVTGNLSLKKRAQRRLRRVSQQRTPPSLSRVSPPEISRPRAKPRLRPRPKPRLRPRPQRISGSDRPSTIPQLPNGLPPVPKSLSEIWGVPKI